MKASLLAGTYEAFAHIWVGFLFGVIAFCPRYRALSIVLLVTVSALELFMFLHK